jgi:autotransporter-associated beta strand protein
MNVVSLDRFHAQPSPEMSGSGCEPLESSFQPTPMAARMTHRRFRSAVMATALALLPSPVWAVVNAGGNSNTAPPADDPGFFNVGSTGGASIVYLGNRWALTASHVFINPGTPLFYSSQAQAYLPFQVANTVTSSVFGSADLKLIDLATDPGLPALTIGTSQPTGGPVVMVGNGRPQSEPNQPIQEYWNVSTPASGTNWSWSSISAPNPPVTPIPASYWTSNSDPPIPQGTYQASTITYDGGQAIRWGQNQVTGTMTVTDQNGHSTAGYYTTFNDPTYAPGPTALGGNEAQASTGDSGGAVFYKNGSNWTLTGAMIEVFTFSSHPDSANPANSSMAVFGELTAVADLTNYRSAILKVITPLPWTGQTGGTGVANSSWDTTSTNWLNALNGSKVYYDASSPIFGDTNPANNNSPITNGNVVVQANGVFPASVSFKNSSVAYLFNDAGTSTMGIGGATGITKTGTGLVTLLGANTFTGPMQISAGRINVQNNSALGASSGVTVNSGAALELQNNVSAGTSSLSPTTTVPLTISGTGLAANPTGGLDSISGNNMYAGGITIGSGGATINSAAASGMLTLSGAISTAGNPLTLSGPGSISVSGNISGAGSVSKTGSGTVDFTGTNSYSGGTTVTGGILITNTLGDAASPITVSAAAGVNSALVLGAIPNGQRIGSLAGIVAPSGSAVVSISPDDMLTVNQATNTTFGGTIWLSGTLIKLGVGTLEITGGPTLSNLSSIQVTSGGLRFNVTSGSTSVGTGVTATVNSGSTLELAGPVSALSSGAIRVNVMNNSTTPGLLVSGTHQQVGNIDGSGTTLLNAGSDLTANHIIQSALVIGGTAGSHGLVTIDASDASGSPLGQLSGLALASSLTPSNPFGTLGMSSANLSTADSNSADLAVLAMGKSVGSDNPSSVPEPSTLALALLAVLGVVSMQFVRHHFRWRTV